MVFKPGTFFGEQPEIEVEFKNHAKLEEDIANALAVAGGIDAADVNVTVDGAGVVLSGSVATQEEIARATAVAEAISGTHPVRNDIAIG
ncbi:BON domain-containing protein [Rhizobium grahamii]|uniref:BON domain-containing protein n=1 Tax=Rhizobium grahamii TaxID=1120045 RepID=A0A5Q0C7V1_9HYPH|nr:MULTISPECIES: BON domain-containing protein [Rhizobium]QFY61493.1 BON domain-containing protein [Rhizobium grahamii]QRM49354.1 BON domain-containing protein [Rhizobium sp. BG6]